MRQTIVRICAFVVICGFAFVVVRWFEFVHVTKMPTAHRIAVALALAGLITATAPLRAQPTDAPPGDKPPVAEEPDDRLPRETQRLIDELTARAMPELVEALVGKQPPMQRAHIARAQLAAALQSKDPAERERFFALAAATYRRVLELEHDKLFLVGERRRLFIAQCRVELGDLMLRHWIVPDLDRFELTSGLDYPRERLEARLREALAAYDGARGILDELAVGVRTEEERFLLLGISQQISRLAQQRAFNAAWATVYLAQIGGLSGEAGDKQLAAALQTFDGVSRQTEEPGVKYNALLGSGLALRALKRYDEAEAALDKVRDSTAPAELTARAAYEKARMWIAAGRFEEARKTAVELAAVPSRGREGGDAGADFYIRLAPLVRAYAWMVEAAAPGADKSACQKSATDALNALADGGAAWADLAQVYLDALSGGPRNSGEKSAVELRNTARRLMAEKKYDEAAKSLVTLLDRTGRDAARERPEAAFNLGVCLFHMDRKRDAADRFAEVAAGESPLARQAAEHALRCRRQLAADSTDAADLKALADSASLLAGRWPDHPLAEEATFVSALAREQIGELAAARAAYERIPPSSPRYWSARRNAVRCLQKSFDALAADAPAEARRAAGLAAATAGSRLADDLAAPDAPKYEPAADRLAAIDDARLTAVEILARADVADFRDGLRILETLPPTPRTLALRIRCLRGLGDLRKAAAALTEFLAAAPAADAGGMLAPLAAEMEGQIERLRAAGRADEAKSMAVDTVEIVRQLQTWVDADASRAKFAAAVRFSLARMLLAAERRDEALRALNDLMRESPDNGAYVRAAAQLHEQEAALRQGILQQREADEAERLWALLLADEGLRDRAPAEYWEARYHWLRHQLRRGSAEEVVKGIETEKAFYPDLGGPPWQAKLLELYGRAKNQADLKPAKP